MDFAFSEEQEQLRGFAREFLADRYDDGKLAEIADSATGVDADVWPRLAEMGWLDAELTFLDQAVLFEESRAPSAARSVPVHAGPGRTGPGRRDGQACRRR